VLKKCVEGGGSPDLNYKCSLVRKAQQDRKGGSIRQASWTVALSCKGSDFEEEKTKRAPALWGLQSGDLSQRMGSINFSDEEQHPRIMGGGGVNLDDQ